MTPFDQKYIENPEYLKWIFNNTPKHEQYWQQYLFEHPDEKKQILELKEYLSQLKFSNETLSYSEKKELKDQILKKINFTIKRNNRRFEFILFKYAAIIIAFAAIIRLIVYLNKDKESYFEQQTNEIIQIPSSAKGPLLITSDGKNVDLKKSNSTVIYSHNGTVVLNNDSVIQAANESKNVFNQIVIPYGNQSRVILSDSTVVWLNSGSRLMYPTVFKDKYREVVLFGEAYFEVTKNPSKPFIVKTSDLEIKVLGTKFNISAYAEDKEIQTVLKEGGITVRQKGAGFFENAIVMKPNQMALFNKLTKDIKIDEVDADQYILWTKGFLSFEDLDIIDVIKKVERFYNISINFSGDQKEIIRISGKLDLKQGRKEAMEYLGKVSLSKVEQMDENQYTIK